MSYFLTTRAKRPQRGKRRALRAGNAIFVAGMLLSPAAIFACPAPSNLGVVTVDASAAGNEGIADTTFTSSPDGTYIHGFHLVDSAGTLSVTDAGGKTVKGTAWHGQRDAKGQGYDFTEGPLSLPEGSYKVHVADVSGVSPQESDKTFTVSTGGNAGDVWLDTVGASAGPGHEMDPHLACANINIWGDKLADGQGDFTIDGWSPSGSGKQDYPRTGSVHTAYDGRVGGTENLLSRSTNPTPYDHQYIDVHELIDAAKANGEAPVNKQGYHFKLQYSQDPQKHKTFWVDCGDGGTPAPTPGPTCLPGAGALSGVAYTGNGATGVLQSARLADVVIPGGSVKVDFTVGATCPSLQFSLVSYQAPTPTFSRNNADQQVVFSQATGFFGPGAHSLSVTVPDCYYQVDFVSGPVITHLGPAGSNSFYSDQGRLIAGANGGTRACAGTPAPSPNPGGSPSPSPSAHPSPSPTGGGEGGGTPSPSPSAHPSPSTTPDDGGGEGGGQPSPNPSPNPAGCTENNFLSALIPAAGSSVAPGSTVGADFADETALNQASVVFTLTGPAGTVGLTPTYSPASSQGHPATLITAVIPAGLATGGYTAHLHAADSDQNHRGGDCGEATWAFTVAPPAPAAHLGIVKTVSPSTSPVPVDSTLTYTITVGNSGDGAAQNVGVTDVISANPADMYSVKTASFVANPAAPHSTVTQTAAGSYLWEIDTIPAGGSATLSFSVTVTRAGTISNTGALVGGPSSHVTTVVREEPVGGITATIELAGTTTTVPGGTVALGSVSQTAYPATFGGLAPNTYCVNATAPAGYTMVGAGQQCVAVTAEHVSQVVFFVTQTPPTTACVLVTIHLAGTGITVPGGSVAVGGQSETLYPFTFCSLTPGQVTAGATAPAGFSLVGPATQTPTLVAGNNPPVVFFVQPNTPAPDCGQVLGEIVLAGSQTVISGGTVTAGGVTHTTYPTPLFPCVTPGSVPVSATAPAGYQFVGPATTTATVEAGKVTPVIFQVTPIVPGGGTGAGQGGVEGAQIAVSTAQHGPSSGVLGTSIGMPLTGSDAILRIGFSVICFSLGLVVLRATRNRRRL